MEIANVIEKKKPFSSLASVLKCLCVKAEA